MKTKFNDFIGEKTAFNETEENLKSILSNAFGDEKYNEKQIINKIYDEMKKQTLPSAIDSIIKIYPMLKSFKAELIAALEEE